MTVSLFLSSALEQCNVNSTVHRVLLEMNRTRHYFPAHLPWGCNNYHIAAMPLWWGESQGVECITAIAAAFCCLIVLCRCINFCKHACAVEGKVIIKRKIQSCLPLVAHVKCSWPCCGVQQLIKPFCQMGRDCLTLLKEVTCYLKTTMFEFPLTLS